MFVEVVSEELVLRWLTVDISLKLVETRLKFFGFLARGGQFSFGLRAGSGLGGIFRLDGLKPFLQRRLLLLPLGELLLKGGLLLLFGRERCAGIAQALRGGGRVCSALRCAAFGSGAILLFLLQRVVTVVGTTAAEKGQKIEDNQMDDGLVHIVIRFQWGPQPARRRKA